MGEDPTRGQSRPEDADASGLSGWVTTDVAARAVRVSPRTIRRYIDRGELKAKVEGEGVERRWLIDVDSLHALRALRPESEPVRGVSGGEEGADSLADVIRQMSARVEERTAEAVEMRIRLELSEQAHSSVEEEARRLREENERLRQELEDLREAQEGDPETLASANTEEGQGVEAPLRQEHRPWWRRWFGA